MERYSSINPEIIRRSKMYRELGIEEKVGVLCCFFDPLCMGLLKTKLKELSGRVISSRDLDMAIELMHDRGDIVYNIRSSNGVCETLISLNHRKKDFYKAIANEIVSTADKLLI